MVDRIGRRLKDAFLDPVLRLLPSWVTPNGITVVSLLPGLAAAVLAAFGILHWALLAFALNRVLDGLDGLLARGRGLQSDLGGYLDIVIDFLVYAAIPIGVWIGIEAPLSFSNGGVLTDPTGSDILRSLPLVVLLAVFYVNAASWMYLSSVLEKRRKARLESENITTVVMPAGLVEGTETVLFYFLFLLFPGQYPILFYLMAAATSVGVVQRIGWAKKHLR